MTLLSLLKFVTGYSIVECVQLLLSSPVLFCFFYVGFIFPALPERRQLFRNAKHIESWKRATLLLPSVFGSVLLVLVTVFAFKVAKANKKLSESHEETVNARVKLTGVACRGRGRRSKGEKSQCARARVIKNHKFYYVLMSGVWARGWQSEILWIIQKA